ncbi:unnamed protein product [Lymnaea stagnalis]|uniref:ZZ-type domain-containing protein n=1 Tax=Lymnaea stagnalis TaxID=6523 RepID=A0AAV2IB42_LYMST
MHVFDNIQCGAFHLPSCNDCEGGITGFIWRCTLCFGLSLCTSCYMSDLHGTSHPFIRYETHLYNG